MTVAFFAPLKAPTHPVPSGDRAMGRALISALKEVGFAADIVSDLRLYDGAGNAETQDDLLRQTSLLVDRLLASDAAPTWRAWLTYHNYYKAPDLIGPQVCRVLGIPYLQVESTRARKRLNGPWERFATAAEAAADAADVIFYLTDRDCEALRRYAPEGQRLIHLAPFLDRTDLPPASSVDGAMLSVGMLRAGDKLASYQIIADTLGLLEGADWALDIVGDGAARGAVESMMAPFGDRVRMHGALTQSELAAFYASAELLFWPGVNEAFGLTYLEAQAAGIPVVAQDRPGVRDVVLGTHPAPRDGPAALAKNISALRADQARRCQQGAMARAFVTTTHLRTNAAATLANALADLGVTAP